MTNRVEAPQVVELQTTEQLAQGIVSMGVQLLEGRKEVSRAFDGASFKILASDKPGTLTIQVDYSTAIKRSFRFPPTYELESTLVGFFLMHDTYEVSQGGVNKTTLREGWTGDDYYPEEFKNVPSAEDLQGLLFGLQNSTETTPSR